MLRFLPLMLLCTGAAFRHALFLVGVLPSLLAVGDISPPFLAELPGAVERDRRWNNPLDRICHGTPAVILPLALSWLNPHRLHRGLAFALPGTSRAVFRFGRNPQRAAQASDRLTKNLTNSAFA